MDKQADNRDFKSIVLEYARQVNNDAVLAHNESFEHLDGFQSVLRYLENKGANRRNYRHYSTRERINCILSDSVIYLTDGSNWNDKYDRDHFNPASSSYRRFGVCLSATTDESIAMWMLYGGTNGNGAMINFDKDILLDAMSHPCYECGYFNDEKQFVCAKRLDAKDIDFRLVDVLYFRQKDKSQDLFIVERGAKDPKVELSYLALHGLQQIIKHKSWSYESEVRFIASISRLKLAGEDSNIKCIKIPLKLESSFIKKRVFDSPVCVDMGCYADSELRGTVDWNLCKGCEHKQH